jgi:hypothetical protein
MYVTGVERSATPATMQNRKTYTHMMNHGLKQSSRIIIDKPDLTDGFMIRSFYGRINKGYVIDEVWIREQDGKIRLLFRKDKHLS